MRKLFGIILIIFGLMISFSLIFAEGETIEITFEDDSFLDYVYIAGFDVPTKDDFSISDGIYTVQNQTGFNIPLEGGSLIHYRVKSKTQTMDGPVFTIDFNNIESDAEAFRLYAMSSNNYYVDVLRMNDYSNLGFDGNNTISLDEWMDFIYYLSPENVLTIFIFNPSDDSGYLSTSVVLPEEWQNQFWNSSMFIDYGFWQGQIDENELSLMIDFINYSTLPIEEYFAEYVDAAKANEDDIHTMLNSGTIDFSELEFWSFDGGDENNRGDEESLNRDDLNIPINLIHTVVENAQVVFEETAEAMNENDGGQFSFMPTKTYDTENDVFLFASEDEPGYLAFNTPLSEIEQMSGERGKGFYFKFMPNADNLRFSYISPEMEEIGILFEEDGSPYLFNSSNDLLIPFMSGETEPCAVVNGNWYHLFFAIDEDNHVKGLIWPVDEMLHNGGFADFVFDGFDAQDWQFVIQFDPAGELLLHEYQIYSIENFPSMFE